MKLFELKFLYRYEDLNFTILSYFETSRSQNFETRVLIFFTFSLNNFLYKNVFFFLIKIPINHSRRRKVFRKNNDPSNYFYFSNRYILHKILEIYRCPYTSLFTSFFSFQAWKRLSSWCRPRVVLVTVMFAICATKKTFTRKRN